jgi:hypothetical protein
MRTIIIAAIVAAAPAAAFAQSTNAYVTGVGGFATSADGTSGNVLGEAGVKVAPHLFVFGDVGRFHDLEPSELQPAVANAASTLSTIGVDVTGTSRVPAWYTTGGLRAQIPAGSRLMPYVFGSVGVARLTPEATFSYTSGTLGDSSLTPGEDVTSQVVSLGEFTQPPATSALMVSGGAGVEAPIARRVVLDASYRYSRLNTDSPLHTQGLTFGVGYRF